jgi:hypothetical protein
MKTSVHSCKVHRGIAAYAFPVLWASVSAIWAINNRDELSGIVYAIAFLLAIVSIVLSILTPYAQISNNQLWLFRLPRRKTTLELSDIKDVRSKGGRMGAWVEIHLVNGEVIQFVLGTLLTTQKAKELTEFIQMNSVRNKK